MRECKALYERSQATAAAGSALAPTSEPCLILGGSRGLAGVGAAIG